MKRKTNHTGEKYSYNKGEKIDFLIWRGSEEGTEAGVVDSEMTVFNS